MTWGFNTIFGEPAKPATGIRNLWGKITRVPATVFRSITTGFSIIKVVITFVILFLLWRYLK